MAYVVRNGKLVKEPKRRPAARQQQDMLALSMAVTEAAEAMFGPEPEDGFTQEQVLQAAGTLDPEIRELLATAFAAQKAA